MRAFFLTTLLSLGVWSEAAAINYYVSGGANSLVAGVDATGNGRGLSASLPFATIQYAADQTAPGDTVFVRQGTYTNYPGAAVVNIKHAGTAARWISFRNYAQEKPLLQFNGWQGFQVKGNIDYIDISGFRIQGNNRNITLWPPPPTSPAAAPIPHWQRPERCTTATASAPMGNATAGYPHHLRFVNNEVFECGGAGIGTGNSDYVTIENNLVYNNCWYTKYGTSGISMNSSHGLRRGGRLPHDYPQQPQLRQPPLRALAQRHQYAKGITDGNGIILDTNTGYTGQFLIANNLVRQQRRRWRAALQIGERRRHQQYVATRTRAAPERYADRGEVFTNQCSNVLVQNNILVTDNLTKVNGNYSTPGLVYNNNLFFGGIGTAVAGTATVAADPRFVTPTTDWTTANFRLSSGSPALNAGVNNLLSASDLAGNPRMTGGKVDLGAYESAAAPLATTAARRSAAPPAFPNPAHTTTELSLPGVLPGSCLQVFDALGRLCRSQPVTTERTVLSVAGLRAGLYTIRVQTTAGALTQRLAVE